MAAYDEHIKQDAVNFYDNFVSPLVLLNMEQNKSVLFTSMMLFGIEYLYAKHTFSGIDK